MAQKSCLGIHYSKSGITAVLVEKQGANYQPVGDWKVSAKSTEEQTEEKSLIGRLAEEVSRQAATMPPVALSLSGTFYQTTRHHSEFEDPEMIAKTLRFDVEEDFAVDTESQAICFQIVDTPGPGSELMVHTVGRDFLQSIFPPLDEAGLDALITVPDMAGWLHYLKTQAYLPREEAVAVIAWADGILYMLVLDRNHQPILARSSICSLPDQLPDLISSEWKRSMALFPSEHKPTSIYYHGGGVQEVAAGISSQVGIVCKPLDETDVCRAFAAGVACTWLEGGPFIDFRSDNLTPRTFIAEKNKSLIGLCVAVVVLLLSLIIITSLHSRYYATRIEKAEQSVKEDWERIRRGDSKSRKSQYTKEIKAELNRLLAKQKGQSSQVASDSASRSLYLILDQLVKVPREADVIIETLRVNTDSSSLSGSVPDLEALKELVKVLDGPESPLKIVNWNFMNSGSGSKSGKTSRRSFNIPLEIKR